MTANPIERTAPPWRTLNDIYEHYLTQTKVAGGKTAADRLEALLGGRGLMVNFRSIPDPRRRQSSDVAFQEQLKKADEQIGEIRNRVRRAMMQEASNGTWVAMGRSRPDQDHELIPPRYWPFLSLDLENNAAAGDGRSFRELRCWIIADLPADDSIREYLRTAQQRTTLQPKGSNTSSTAALNFTPSIRTGPQGGHLPCIWWKKNLSGVEKLRFSHHRCRRRPNISKDG